MKLLQSPCKNSCELDAALQNCLGCGRSLSEIEKWSHYSPEQRASIMKELPDRLKKNTSSHQTIATKA
ncbi:DUF1289 domain-containing protein [Hirschia litorea]|uniref:DUF1289 domain-containing protein n=1 Tax=Hirschia litorea TaxID=1199156 RepID=A0ABW2IGV4_9PROT